MVASCGWIMPAPFARPSTVIVFVPDRRLADAILGRVSVVMIALLKARTPRWLADRDATSSDNLARIFSTGSGTPMMPVEEGKISDGETPQSFPASRQTRSQA